MRYILVSFIIYALYGISSAEVALNVIYPKSDQQLPAVDSTFIFGSVAPGANLRINGEDIRVHAGGGWLAFLPVEQGSFLFRLTAYLNGDTAYYELPVQIGPPELIEMQSRPLIPNSSYPDSDVIYSVGDIFEFSFRAPPDGVGWFSIDGNDAVKMFPSTTAERADRGSVFDEARSIDLKSFNYVTYVGHYRFAPADTGRHLIHYGYNGNGDELLSSSVTTKQYLSTDSILTVLSEFPPVIGILSGTTHIIRTGPRLGYKLLYLPSGIMVRVTGAQSGYYRLKLGNGITGFTNIDSVTLLPPGTLIPKGRATFILVNGIEEGVEISTDIGVKLPYEIREDLSSDEIEIDIFGVTGDVDWIRFNLHDRFISNVKWSQPADDIFRITVEIGEGAMGGYYAYYDNTEFTLRITKKPKSRRRFSSSLKGVRVTIDPGHSHDSGAVGPTGLKEKDANLWIAHELRLMLMKKGADVMMTRYGHENIALYDRPKIAERWGADLLISIHNNALPDGINPFVNNGVSVYYYHPHSRPLAEAIHDRLPERTGLPDHGLYYGNLVLTRPTSIPAVLVECAFMMLPEQEALLRTDRFQRKCAKAILEGIQEFLRD